MVGGRSSNLETLFYRCNPIQLSADLCLCPLAWNDWLREFLGPVMLRHWLRFCPQAMAHLPKDHIPDTKRSVKARRLPEDFEGIRRSVKKAVGPRLGSNE